MNPISALKKDDLEFVICSNTGLLSKRKLEQLGVRHVSIMATFNGKTIFQCDGAKGAVKECE